MSLSAPLAILLAIVSVALVLLDPLWVRAGQSYWRFTPMMRRLRLSPRLRTSSNMEALLRGTGAFWGCPIEWRRSPQGIEFHGRGIVWQWLGCGRIVDPDGDGWLSVEFPLRQHILIPIAVANVLLVGPLGWPVAAGLMLSVTTAFVVQRLFAQRVELAARWLVVRNSLPDAAGAARASRRTPRS